MARSDLEEWADGYFLDGLGLAKRKTFSCPSYYFGRSMVAFLFEDALGIKLPPEHVLEHVAKDPDTYSHFKPGGESIMKNWLLITYPEANEYDQEQDLLAESLAFVRSALKSKAPKKA